MIDIAISLVRKIDNINDAYYVYKLAFTFSYLAKFEVSKINDVIKEYTKHKEYLVSYNAERFL